MRKSKLSKGDTIRCRNAVDAGDVIEELQKDGYEWEFLFEHDETGKKTILIVILGRYDEQT